MPGNSGTVSLPRRGRDAQVPGVGGVGFPTRIPGGLGGPAPVPSRLTFPVAHVSGGPPVPGGRYGRVTLFTPSIDKTVPYFIGHNEGFSVASNNGSPIQWLRRFFANRAGVDSFQAQQQTTPAWSSNATSGPPLTPSVPVPMSHKHLSQGGYFREYAVDEQLFDQLTDRHNPWPIQKGVRQYVHAAVTAQPQMTRPYPYQLTRYQPAAAYGQTTETLIPQALSNLLPASNTAGANPQPIGGSPYGSY